MRGLFKAALVVFAPALAFAYVVPEVAVDNIREQEEPVADRSITRADVVFRNDGRSPDETPIALPFRLEVLPSEQACGYGNITVNGRVLPQKLEGDVTAGKGLILMSPKTIISATWSFECVKVNNQPDSQLLKLVVDLIDGKPPVEDIAFSVLFKQTGTPEIVNVNPDLTLSDSVAAKPNPERLLLIGENVESQQYNVEDELAELDWMYAQLHELKLMIAEKHEAIATHAWEHSDDYEENIKECDNLKCILKAVYRKIKHTAGDVLGQLTGDEEMSDESGHFPKPPFKKPHWPKIPKIPFHPGKGKHGNHTCGPPRHGKHNHTHPPPHHRPHHFLPICRLPPHHVPHHPPPHHGPPSNDYPLPPPPHHQEPFHDPNIPTPPPPFPRPMTSGNSPTPPPVDHFGPPHGPTKHRSIHKTLQIVQYTVIGFLIAFLLIALHRRACTHSKCPDRKARREERHRRRALRRAAHKHAISRFLSRMSGDHSGNDESSDDYDEKRAALLSDSEDAISTTMTDEIAEFRNAASIVDDMVSAEEGRARTVAYAHGLLPEPIPIPADERDALMREYNIGSQMIDGEELPAYEDNDGSEISSVADGFRYTPGSSDYSPQYSASGSVDDVLGSDTKA